MNRQSLHIAIGLSSVVLSLILTHPLAGQTVLPQNSIEIAAIGNGRIVGPDIPRDARAPSGKVESMPRSQSVPGLTINATLDSSITTNPNSALIQAAIYRVINIYRAQFKDDVTVSILFRYSTTQPDGSPIGTGSIASCNYVIYSVPWANFVSNLQTDGKTTNDVAGNASLPGGALSSEVYVSSPNGRVLGFVTPGTMTSTGTAPGGSFDGIITMNSAQALAFTRPAGGSYDAQKVLQHEINEILGMGSFIGYFANLRPMDIFSWSAAGTRNYTSGGSRYFSINGGAANIINFNQNTTGDLGDWASGNCPHPDPYVQNASACPGEYADVADWTPEEVALDVIGYDSIAPASKAPFDIDGDGRTDLSVFRPAVGEWWYLKSNNGANGAAQFGSSSDTIVPADMTGDGRTDMAFFRPSNGFWYVLRSEDHTYYAFPFGSGGDIPVPADFDGDAKADAAVFRSSNATWYISNSTGGTTIRQFGIATDLPVAADFDGDGKADTAVFRPNGTYGAEWWIAKSSGGLFATQFGLASDRAIPADYTGDTKADVAFWRPSTGTWYILRSEDLTYFAFPFGSAGDQPIPGDYDGDGKMDAAVFRPASSTWYLNRSTAGTYIQQFGTAGDQPLPNSYIR